ncbi:MAG: tetratricopeptide repeat protein [Flavobacteriales bacterium]|nr:tetratricopeptide repeat protein [Flavobacteriales bacterium]
MAVLSGVGFAQQTTIYTDEYADFRAAQDLYDKEHYSAAQEKFFKVIGEIDNPQDEIRINSEYYAAICALELFHKDAEHLLNQFLFSHPDHPKGKKINFQLGRYYYRTKKLKDAIEYFEKVDQYDLSPEEKIELQFKLGYSYFNKEDYEKAKPLFYQVIQSENEYYVPAQYYYSHLAYLDENYQTALEGFLKISDDPMFASIVPYYVTQIYYKQGKYQELLEYAPKYVDEISDKRKGEFLKLIGDSHYYLKQYEDAIPFLLEYRKSSNPTREDYYQLGHAYYASGQFDNATKFLGKAVTKKDAMSQVAYHQMGDAYLKLEQKEKARNAFKAASELDFDQDVRKNALYNYAKLAYELSNNPYNEAIDAFQQFIEDYPQDPQVDEAYEFLLKVYMTTKNYDEALRSLEKIKKMDDRMKMAYQSISYNLAVQEFHNQQYQAAITNFKKAQKYSVSKELTSESYYWIAEANYNLKNYDVAISNYVEFKLEPGAALSSEFQNADYGIAYAYFMKASPFDVIDNWENESVQNQHNTLINQAVTAFRNFIILKDRVEPVKLQDAYMRLADCYYLLRDDQQAINYYNTAISNGSGDLSYAYFQKAEAQGNLQNNSGRAATLESMLSKYPNSPYVVRGMLDLADAYKILNENQKAITSYKNFVSKYPNNANVARALSDIGFLYLRLQDYNNAEKYALKVLDTYPHNKVEVEKSLETMRGVYEGRGDLPGYYDWLASRGYQVKPSEKDSTLWEPVQYAYDNGDCGSLIKNGKIYIAQLPNGKEIVNAHFYMASCYYNTDKDLALTHYAAVIDRGITSHYEEALQYAGYIVFDKKDYTRAIEYYSKLENAAVKEENIRTSRIALMHSYKHNSNYAKTIEYANKVLELSGLEENLIVEATLNKGLAQKELMVYDEAKVTLLECSQMTKTIMGAEAKYNYSEILFLESNHTACEKSIMELVKQKPSYDYWVAKGIILLGRNYMAVEDYFNAKHSLQSVVDHYDGKDKAEIVNTAQQLIDEIIAIENAQGDNKSMKVEDEEIEFENNLNEKEKSLFDNE